MVGPQAPMWSCLEACKNTGTSLKSAVSRCRCQGDMKLVMYRHCGLKDDACIHTIEHASCATK
eukprot:10576601-Karenia_brevis.AAC.1